MKKTILALVLASASMLAQAAVFDGKSAQFRYFNGDFNRPLGAPAIVAPDVPVNFQGTFRVNLSGNNIVVDFLKTSTFNSNPGFRGFRINDVNNVFTDFKSFSVLSNNGMPDLVNDRLTFDADNLYVNFRGLTFQKGKSVVLGVTTAPTTPVPEPETYALMGLGLVGLLAARRRKALNA